MADFHLSDDDRQYLTASYRGRWKMVAEGDKHGIIIYEYELPDRYTPEKSHLMLIIPADYPVGRIDMFYFSPPISRKDGSVINALAVENHFRRDWQRWSRHYEWHPGEHSVVSHIEFVHNQLENDQ